MYEESPVLESADKSHRHKLVLNLAMKQNIYTEAYMATCGFKYTDVGDTTICEHCELKISNWTSFMNPLEIHSERSPHCSFIKSMKTPLPRLTDTVQENPPKRIKTSETDFMQDIIKRSFSIWLHPNAPSSAQMIEAGFFNCNVGDRVTCLCCNLTCEQWIPHIDDPCEVHKTLSPDCTYVRTKLISRSTQFASLQSHDISSPSTCDCLYIESPTHHSLSTTRLQENSFCTDRLVQTEHARGNEAKQSVNDLAQIDLTINHQDLLTSNESNLSALVTTRLHLPISQQLLDKGFELSIIKRCWENQLRLKQGDFASAYDLFIACSILRKQIEPIDGKKENIVIPSIAINKIREEEQKQKALNWKEDRSKTKECEESLLRWPRGAPTPIKMLKSGWLLDQTKEEDHTACPHCHIEHNHWQSTDDPLIIHNQLSPSCPFVLAKEPIHRSSVPVKFLNEVYTPEEVGKEAVKPGSRVVLTSHSHQAPPPNRANSFDKFPYKLAPTIIDGLVSSGFYYADTSTLLKCYECGMVVNDFHLYPAEEINAKHCDLSPNCRYAQLMAESNVLQSTRTYITYTFPYSFR